MSDSQRYSQAVIDTRPFYVIYERPLDHPQSFVVREWFLAYGDPEASNTFQLANTIEEARSLIPPGLFRIERSVKDEPQIVETWL